ncbi:hypothetical protein PIB30_100273, partial [Stylosanthes scabra]|nr:hypothetical protein [Stylosanthes scabra]
AKRDLMLALGELGCHVWTLRLHNHEIGQETSPETLPTHRPRLGHVWGVLGHENEAVSRLSHVWAWPKRGAPA